MKKNLGKNGGGSSRYRYLYCLVPTRKKCFVKLRGIGGAEISTIHFKDVAAVVSEATSGRYEILDDGLLHEAVVEAVRRNYDVLPMGFGQVATEQDIRGFMNRNYPRIKDLFGKLEGKTELGVKVMGKTDRLMREVVASDNRIANLQKKIASMPEAAAYPHKIEMGKIAEEQMKTRGERVATDIIRQLRAHSEDFRRNPNLTEEMLLNAAFLVKDEDESAFDQAVCQIEKTYGELVEIRYVTSPPYDFADLRIRR